MLVFISIYSVSRGSVDHGGGVSIYIYIYRNSSSGFETFYLSLKPFWVYLLHGVGFTVFLALPKHSHIWEEIFLRIPRLSIVFGCVLFNKARDPGHSNSNTGRGVACISAFI